MLDEIWISMRLRGGIGIELAAWVKSINIMQDFSPFVIINNNVVSKVSTFSRFQIYFESRFGITRGRFHNGL